MTDAKPPEHQEAGLFDLDAVLEEAPAGPWKPGRVELLLLEAIRLAYAKGTLIPEDAGLIGGALAGARALDVAERTHGKGGGPYATAALLTPYREVLQALRLPAAVAPAEEPRAPAGGHTEVPDSLRDLFGTAE